jgi:hypothetical protein
MMWWKSYSEISRPLSNVIMCTEYLRKWLYYFHQLPRQCYQRCGTICSEWEFEKYAKQWRSSVKSFSQSYHRKCYLFTKFFFGSLRRAEFTLQAQVESKLEAGLLQQSINWHLPFCYYCSPCTHCRTNGVLYPSIVINI